MAELIDISNEKFWDILFDEACVEGQQAERIENALKQIATTEAEIRAKAISEFAEYLKEIESISTKCTCSQSDGYSQIMRICDAIAEQLKEE